MMGLLDNIVSGAIRGALQDPNAMPGILQQILGKTEFGSVGGLLSQLQQGGLGREVSSWLSNGHNLPITAEQLRSALQSDQVRQIAEAAGVPVDKLLALLSQHLPQTVDKMSPNGTLQEDSSAADGPQQDSPPLQQQAGIDDVKGS